MAPVTPHGLTIALQAGADTIARTFYATLFGREPDCSPHEDFHEWQITRDAWVQIHTGCDPVTPSLNRMRFQVDDLTAATDALSTRGITVDAPTTLPGVVVFTNLSDPWGNPLGLFQDIASGDSPVIPGGTVRDASHFLH